MYSDKHWFAFQVRVRSELKVAEALQYKVEEVFSPYQLKRKYYRGRMKVMPEVLYDGYLFCHLRSTEILPVLTTPGVKKVVCLNAKPAVIRDEEIENIRLLVDSKLPIDPHAEWRPGLVVKVLDGPLRGVSGVVVRSNSDQHLLITITLLNRSVMVQLDPLSICAVLDEAPSITKNLKGNASFGVSTVSH